MEHKSSNRAEEKLLSAVIALAIQDVCLPPVQMTVKGNKKAVVMSHNAYTAYKFLFFDADGYYAALDMDPKQFKQRLERQLRDMTTGRPFEISNRNRDLIGKRKRMFKLNESLYFRRKAREYLQEEISLAFGDKSDDV
jgi:hypothetical protein